MDADGEATSSSSGVTSRTQRALRRRQNQGRNPEASLPQASSSSSVQIDPANVNVDSEESETIKEEDVQKFTEKLASLSKSVGGPVTKKDVAKCKDMKSLRRKCDELFKREELLLIQLQLKELQRIRAVQTLKKQEEEMSTRNPLEEGLNLVLQILEVEFNCSICSEIYIEPTVLSCGHTFCNHCISTWKKENFECPICRTYMDDLSKHVEMDNFLVKLYTYVTPDVKEKREQLILERCEESYNESVRVRVESEPQSPDPWTDENSNNWNTHLEYFNPQNNLRERRSARPRYSWTNVDTSNWEDLSASESANSTASRNPEVGHGAPISGASNVSIDIINMTDRVEAEVPPEVTASIELFRERMERAYRVAAFAAPSADRSSSVPSREDSGRRRRRMSRRPVRRIGEASPWPINNQHPLAEATGSDTDGPNWTFGYRRARERQPSLTPPATVAEMVASSYRRVVESMSDSSNDLGPGFAVNTEPNWQRAFYGSHYLPPYSGSFYSGTGTYPFGTPAGIPTAAQHFAAFYSQPHLISYGNIGNSLAGQGGHIQSGSRISSVQQQGGRVRESNSNSERVPNPLSVRSSTFLRTEELSDVVEEDWETQDTASSIMEDDATEVPSDAHSGGTDSESNFADADESEGNFEDGESEDQLVQESVDEFESWDGGRSEANSVVAESTGHLEPIESDEDSDVYCMDD